MPTRNPASDYARRDLTSRTWSVRHTQAAEIAQIADGLGAGRGEGEWADLHPHAVRPSAQAHSHAREIRKAFLPGKHRRAGTHEGAAVT